MIILKELEKLILELELKYKKKSISPRVGKTILHRMGRGMDFKESRLYSYGDDIRFIDWNVTSKMNDVYVKVFHEETDREINLFLDVSSSMNFKASNDRSKFFIAFQLLAFFTLLGISSGDRVNIYPYSTEIHHLKKNIKTKSMAYKFLKEIYDTEFFDKTNHLVPFEYLKNRAKKNSITYILSDFNEMISLEHLKSVFDLHEIYAVRIFDPIEEDVGEKFLKNFFILNKETKIGSHYNSSFKKDSKILKETFRNSILDLRTNSNLTKELIRFLIA